MPSSVEAGVGQGLVMNEKLNKTRYNYFEVQKNVNWNFIALII